MPAASVCRLSTYLFTHHSQHEPSIHQHSGLAVALDMSLLLESMSLHMSPGDVIALCAAAQVERSPAGAVAVARRLELVQSAQRGGGDELATEVAAADVAALAVGLVELCLEVGDARSADEVMEVRVTHSFVICHVY